MAMELSLIYENLQQLEEVPANYACFWEGAGRTQGTVS